MKKNYLSRILPVIATLFTIGFYSYLNAESKNSSAQPRMVISERVFDFGMLPAGKSVEHEFVIKNEGKAELEIFSVNPT